jgi:hypothetical protein
MGVSEPQRKHATDHSTTGASCDMTVHLPLAVAPFFRVNKLINYHWFEQLPLALQWCLVLLIRQKTARLG